MRIVISLLFLLVSNRANAQTWAELSGVERSTPVRVYEVGGKGWSFVDGKLLLVKDDELTILRSGRPLVISKPVIAKIEMQRNDSPAEGALIGALSNVLLGLRGGWQGCSSGSSCVVTGIASWAALGALVDWRIKEKKTVYRAP